MPISKYLTAADPWHSREPLWCEIDSAAQAALVLLHGRGGGAKRMLEWAKDNFLGVSLYAPQAADDTWYPQRFLQSTTLNQPYLDSALERVAAVIDYVQYETELSNSQIFLLGFSQGACLAAEYCRRHPRRLAGLILMSGGVIGNDYEASEPVSGTLERTPVYLGCDDNDPFIPFSRVELTAELYIAADASVALATYRNFGHRPHLDAVRFTQSLIADMYS